MQGTLQQGCKGILYFTDDDMEADPNLLSEMLSTNENPNLATATGLVLPKFEVKPLYGLINILIINI